MLELTKEELEKKQREELEKLITFCTTYTHLARMLGVNVSTVRGWVDRGRISKKGAKQVEQNERLKCDFKAKQLRPDL